MTIPWVGDEGLFPRLGKHGKTIRAINNYQLVTLPPLFEEIMLQYDTDRDVAAQVPPLLDSAREAAGGAVTGPLQGVATDTVNRMVFEDDRQFSREDIEVSLREVIRQMRASSQTVKACAVTAAVSPLGTPNGDGTLLVSTKRGDGLEQENLFAEVAVLTCTADAQTGGAEVGSETFSFAGDVPQGDPFHWEWPLGSGGTATVQALDPGKDNAAGNLLVNGSFEAITANVPNQWTLAVGVAGTDLVQEAATVYDGTKAIRFNPTAALTELSQTFNDAAAGTSGTLEPLTQYAVGLRLRGAGTIAAGTLSIALVDGAGAIVKDELAVDNAFNVTLSSVPSSSWLAASGVFRLPRVLPTTAIKLRLKITTALAGAALIVDHVALGSMTELYPGGPALALFPGQKPWVRGDRYALTTTNDRGGATLNSTFQTLCERLFAMRDFGLLLPSSASPTIPDTLITA